MNVCVIYTHDVLNALSVHNENCRLEPLQNENEILGYLQGGKVVRFDLEVGYDVLSKDRELLPVSTIYRTDGYFVWEDALAYYISKYHVPIPDEFVFHMRRNDWKCPSIDGWDNEEKMKLMNALRRGFFGVDAVLPYPEVE